jgi:hypothetical protein
MGDRTVIKRMVAGEIAPAYAPGWATLSEEEREAVLVAVAAASAGIQAGVALEAGA